MATATKTGTFTKGSSTRTVFTLSAPLPDHYPDVFSVVKIERPNEDASYFPAGQNGEIACYSMTDRETAFAIQALAQAEV